MIEKQFGIEIDPTYAPTIGGRSAVVPPNPKQYEQQVRIVLGQILKSQVGQDLAASLRYHGKKTLVGPYTGGDCNAMEWWWGSSASQNHSVVLFTPHSARGETACAKEIRSRRPATLPHETLFHELVHSLRRVSGKRKGWSIRDGGTLTGQQDIEEFIAVLVTNIYISDPSNPFKTGLRNDHSGHGPLDSKFDSSFRFFSLGTKAFNLVRTFCDDNPGFTRMLAKVRAPFNPIAAYYQDRRKAFEMAAQGDSEAAFARVTPLDYVEDPSGAWVRIWPYRGPPR